MVIPLRTLAKHSKRFTPLLAAPAALLLSQEQAKAVLTYNIFESGGDVVFQTSGSPPTVRKRTRSALYALAAETHCQASIPLTKWSLRHQAMADDNFGGMTPKGNVAWVPTALSALATMELA